MSDARKELRESLLKTAAMLLSYAKLDSPRHQNQIRWRAADLTLAANVVMGFEIE